MRARWDGWDLNMIRLLFAFCLMMAGPVFAGEAPASTPENIVYLDLDTGRVIIRMRPDLAPKHVERLKHLIRGGYFDGLAFYRVIPDFTAQTGDLMNNGSGPGTGRLLNAEFSRTPQVRGTVSMARTSRRNSADTEWFIVLADNPDTRESLDGKYTVWGQVTSGMEFVDQIPKGAKSKDGRDIANPGRIVKMMIGADAEAPKQDVAALLKRSDAAAAAREFSGAEVKCAGLINGAGVTAVSALAPIWTHAYLAGRFAATGRLTIGAADTNIDTALEKSCTTYPLALLQAVAAQDLGKDPIPLPPANALFSTADYTCGNFAAARKAKDDFVALWAIGFIQGYKNVGQPELEIAFDSRPRLLDAIAAACTKFPDRNFLELMSAIGAKVTIK
jgi:peptidylprolyl isomerase